MTVNTKPKAPLIDELVNREDALEAQVHLLYPGKKQPFGTYGLRLAAVTCPDPAEALDRLAHQPDDEVIPSTAPPLDGALPLWMRFFRYEEMINPQTSRPAIMQHRVGGLAVNVGNRFQDLTTINANAPLSPALRLWLGFFPLDRQRKLPDELFRLARQHGLLDDVAAFRQQVPRPAAGYMDPSFTMRYAEHLIATTQAQDPAVGEVSFWQNAQARITKMIEKE